MRAIGMCQWLAVALGHEFAVEVRAAGCALLQQSTAPGDLSRPLAVSFDRFVRGAPVWQTWI